MKIREKATGVILNVVTQSVVNELINSGKYEEVKEEAPKQVVSSKPSFKKIETTKE